MARRIQRAAPISDRPSRPPSRPRGWTPGRRDVGAPPPVQSGAQGRIELRSASAYGRAVASVYGGPLATEAGVTLPDGKST